MNVLITGGAGFIGTALTRRLLKEGCAVTILDNFNPQVHGQNRALPTEIAGHVRLDVGDVRDAYALERALHNQDVVVHLAAETGTGQSLYEVVRYEDTNVNGTAVLVQCLLNQKRGRLGRVVLASSRAVYGEGQYHCDAHGMVVPATRSVEKLKTGCFEPLCPVCGASATVQPTPETCPPRPSSFYGLTKLMQEQTMLLFAEVVQIPVVALRYQNVYGAGQSLHNPYTGILAIFANLARTDRPIKVFEDGMESRDFVHVEDAVEATWQVMQDRVHAGVFNVGTGERVSVIQVARQVVEFFSSRSPVVVTGSFRYGDIRHSVADIAKLQKEIGYRPTCSFATGVKSFLSWAEEQEPVAVGYEEALAQMRDRGLYHE